MENSVKSRIDMLKNELKLNDIEFCTKANISTATLFRLKRGEEMSNKVIRSICEAFGVSHEWLLNGEGEMNVTTGF